MYSKDSGSLMSRLQQVRLLVADCDGVLTDGGVYYSDAGECLKRFDIRDGMAVERLLTLCGIEAGIISGETSSSLQRRAEKLAIRECHLGVKDKSLVLYALADRRGYGLEQIAYIGDDVNDLGVMSVVGVSACPGDALDNVQNVADYVCRRFGGRGAFREFAELIIQAQKREGGAEPGMLREVNRVRPVTDLDMEASYLLESAVPAAGC